MDNLIRPIHSLRTKYVGLFALCLVNSLIQRVSSESNYAAVVWTDVTDEKFCMAHNDKFHTLPESLSEAESLRLVDLTTSPFQSLRYLCSAMNAPSSQHADSVLAVLRGNCSFSDKARVAQSLGASAVIIVAEELSQWNYTCEYGLMIYNIVCVIEQIVPNASQPSDYHDINITLGVMLSVDYAKIVSIFAFNQQAWPRLLIKLLTSSNEAHVKLYSPASRQADYSIILLAFIAISTVAVGSYWSGIVRHQINLHRNGLASPGSHAWYVARREDVGSVPLTAVTVLFCVVIMVAVLLGLYFFYDYLVYVFIVIFGLSSGYALYDCLSSLLMLFPPFLTYRIPENSVYGLKKRPEIKSIVLCMMCMAVGVWWIIERNSSYAWILQDILGAALCLHLLKQIRITSFKVCFVLLMFTFVYDIFFVFITPLFTKNGRSIMIDVATGGRNRNNDESPIALSKENNAATLPLLMISPRLGNSDMNVCGVQFSMLGFGDILVPGLLVSFCHGFDLLTNTGRIYYIANCIAYTVGLVLTWVALMLMRTGQPALLYIVPCLIITTTVIGAIRRELPALWTGSTPSQDVDLPQLDPVVTEQRVGGLEPPPLDDSLDADSSKELMPIVPPNER